MICIFTVLCHISDLFILRWIEFCMVFNAKCQMEMLYLDVRPSNLSAYTETAISHVSSTSFFVLYFVSSFEMAPFAACEMIVRGGACVCVCVCPRTYAAFVFPQLCIPALRGRRPLQIPLLFSNIYLTFCLSSNLLKWLYNLLETTNFLPIIVFSEKKKRKTEKRERILIY